MKQLKELNQLRERLEVKEKKLSTEVYLLGEDHKLPLLEETKKHRKKTEKMIFGLIDKIEEND